MYVKRFLVILVLLGTMGCSAFKGIENRNVLQEGEKTNEQGKPSFMDQSSPYQGLDSLKEGVILHVPTGVEVKEEVLLDYLASSRIIYVGEVHSNMQHHRVQLKILQGLEKRFPGQIAVGMEMFQRPAQTALDQWRQGELDQKGFMKLFFSNWSQGYPYYREIFGFILRKNIPLIALNVSDEVVMEVSKKGFENVSEETKEEIPDLDLSDHFHRKALEAAFSGHSHGGKKGFEQFLNTMLLWDETMAESVVNFLKSPEGKNKKMVVLTGGFHVAHGYGVPRRVFRRFSEPYTTVLPYTPVHAIPSGRKDLLMEISLPQLPLYIADFVWSVGYEEIKEKRVSLGVQIEKGEDGVRVMDVLPASAASKAGIQPGDIVISFEGKRVKEPFDLSYGVGLHHPGDKVSIKILRDGKALEVEATFSLP